MPRERKSQHKAAASGNVPPETGERLDRLRRIASPVRFDPTATADKIFSGLLAEGVPVVAADAQSVAPACIRSGGGNYFTLSRTGPSAGH